MARPKVPSLKVTGCVALFVVGLAFLLLADVAHGQCTVPNPQPYGLVLNSDLSIGVCLGWTWVAPPSSIVPLVTQWLPEKGLPIPAIVSTATNPNLIFASTSSIQMSFISETASYRNSLGYFVYDENQKVVSSNVVFPDFSSNPTTLGTGQTVKVGPFATGTRVGFFLVGNGYNDYFWATNLASMTFYSLWGLNADKKQHVAMFTEGITGRIIVGFEDLYNLGDADYNDAVFLVSVEGNIVNNLFPTTLMVTTYRNRDVRFTLQLNLGVAKSIVFNSLPSQGFLSQVNSDGTKGATITSTAATVTNPNLYLFFTPAINTHGQPYTTFSMSQTMPDGQVVPVIVRVDVVPFGIYTPWAYGASIPTTAARMTLIQLTGYEAYNVNLYATITAIPTFGILYQYNAGAVGARITAGNTPVTDPINRLYYQSNNQFITAAFWDTFQFVMSNTAAVSPTAQVSILVYVRPNNAPVSSSVRIIIDQNSVGNIDITATDADGDPLTLTVLTIPTTGQIFPTTDGSSRGTRITAAGTVVPSRATNSWRIIAVPNTITSGTAVMSFQFRISDFLSSNTYTATTNVNFVNQAPVSSPVSLTIWESSTMNSVVNTLWRVHANCDRDNAVTTLSVVILSVPSTGTLIDNNGVTITADTLPRTFANGLQVSYTPPFIGFGAPFATFSFRIIDDRGATSAPNTFTFNVNHVNHAPTAIIPSSVSTNLNVPVTIAISGVELDVGDTLVFYTTLPRRTDALLMIGNRNISADVKYPLPPTGATITYYPAAFQHYTDYIYVWVSDQLGAANVRLCYIYVNYVNILPVAQPITIYKNQLSPVDIILSATDANIPAERITYSIRSLPTRGTLSINRRVITTVPFLLGWNVIAPFRTVTYTNPPNSFGDPYATFTYSASDGKADSIPVAVTIHVGQTNQQPQSTMSPSLLQTKRFTPVTFAITTTDPDANDQVKIRFTIPVEFLGTLSLDGAPISDGFETPLAPLLTSTTFVYSPPDLGTNMDFGEKLDTFQYTAIDSNNLAAATVSVPIDVAYVARSPVITSSPSTISIQEQQQRVTTVNTNEPDGLPITVLVSSVPTNGKLYFADSQGLPTGDAITSGQVIASDSFGDTSTRIVYVAPIPPSVFVSLGASRDTYALTCRNSGKSTNLIVNAIVADRNFPPFVSATSPSVTIQSSQTSQTVIFTISGVDPDGNIINALATTISTSPGVTATNGDSALVANSPLTRATANANSWFITVNVPALTFGTVATITVITRDSLSASSTPLTLRLAINRVNFAPVTLTGSTPDCNEDSMVDIPLGGQDDNGDAITAYISQLPSIGTVTFGGVSVTTSTPLVMTNGIATVRYTPPLLNDGRPLTTFRYYVFDGQLRSSEQTLSINVNPVNHAPTAVVPASVSTNMNTPASIVIKGQDVDAGDTLTFMVTSLPTKVGSPLVMGSTVIAVNTEYPLPSSGVTLTYTPVTNQYYSDSIGVRVLDNSKAFDSKTVPVVVNYVNILPVTQSQSVTTNEDTPVSITLVATDANLPEETLSFTIRTLPSKGTLSVNGNAITTVPFSLGTSNTVSFTNAPYSHGSPYTTFAFTANDGKADSATSTVTISVTHVNHPPVSTISSNPVQTNRYTPVTFTITPNDYDANDQVKVRFTIPAGFLGSLSIGGTSVTNGFSTSLSATLVPITLVYTPPPTGASKEFGDNLDAFQYAVVDDSNLASAAASVSINVAFVARNPVITSSPLTISIQEQQQQSTTVNVKDLDGLPITVLVSSVPANGKLYFVDSQGLPTGGAITNGQVISTGSAGDISTNIVYVAPIPSSALVSLGPNTDTYTLTCRNSGKSTNLIVNAIVADRNFPPFVSATSPSVTIQSSQTSQTVIFTISGVDPDGDVINALATTISTSPGVTATNGGSALVANSPLTRATANANSWFITVNVPALTLGTVATITVITRDSLSATSLTPLTLTLTVNYVNFAPATTTTTTPEFDEDTFVDIELKGQDDNGDAITAYISQLPSIGTVTFGGVSVTTSTPLVMTNGIATVRYTPPLLNDGRPLTTFRYYVFDGQLRSSEQTLSINVNPVNHAPTAVVPASVSTNMNTPAPIVIKGQDVDAGDTLTFMVTSLPTKVGSPLVMGSTVIAVNTEYPLPSSGVTLTYTPVTNQYYSDSVGVRVLDNSKAFDSKTVPVVVNYVNILPVTQSQSVTTNEDTPVSITLVATDANLPEETLSFTIRTLPSKGTLSVNGNAITTVPFSLGTSNTVSFTNAPYSHGSPYTTFAFTANDGKADSATSTVTISVTHVNHPPVVSTSSSKLSASRSQRVPFVVVAQDFDSLDELTVTVRPTNSQKGIFYLNDVELNGVQTFSYGNYEAMQFAYVAPSSGSGDNINYASIVVEVSDKGSTPATVTVSFDVLFKALPPKVSSSPSTPSLDERDSLPIVIQGIPDSGYNVDIQLEISSIPKKGKLYYIEGNGNEVLLTGPATVIPFNATVTAMFLYAHTPSDLMVSEGAQSDSFNVIVKNDQSATTYPVNIAIKDKNFSPFIYGQTDFTILDSQSDRHVTFALSGIDPDVDILDAYVLSHKNTEIKLQQDGNDVDITKPLKKVSDGLWKLDVVVPALFVGEVDRIKVYTQDPLGLKSSELELVVRTTYVNFAPVTTTTSIPAFNEDQSVTFTIGGKDDNKEALSAFISGFPSIGTLKDSNGNAITSNSTAISGGANGEWTLTYTPPLYTFGNPLTSIRYYVKDEELQSAEQTLPIVVIHVNHAPVASAQTPILLYEDSFADMTLIGNDVDSSDELVIHFVSIPSSIASLGSDFTFTSTGEAITTNKTYNLPRDGIKVRFTPPMYQFFDDIFTFEVSDGYSSSKFSVNLTILDLNHIPVGYSQTIDMDEDSETLITLTGSDVDIPADTLTFTISTVPSRGNLYDGDVLVKDGHLLSGNTVTFKPLKVTYGAPYTSFTYTVFDGKISSTRESIVINVHHINHAPTISTTPSSVTIDRYGQGSFVVGGKDVDLIDTISLRAVIPQSLNGKVLYNGTQVSDGQVFVYDTTSFTEAFTYVGPLETEGVTPDYGDNYGTITFVVFDNANSTNSQSSTEVSINIRFISRTPTASSDVSLIVVNERESGSVTLSGSDRDSRNVTLVLKIAPSIGSLYLSNSDKALSVGDTIGAGVSPNISVRYASPQPSSEYASTGAQSGSFSFEVNNGDKSVESKIDISIRDVNFAPFVFATEANITIPDSQSDRHVTFALSGIDPDVDITDAYVLSHKNTEIKLQQDGNDVDMTKPLKKVSDGLWKLDVVVPALFVGEVDRIKVYTQDPLGLKSSELELVVRTAYVNFAPVTTTTSIPAFNEDQSVTFTIGGKDDNKEALSAFISELPQIGTLKDSNGNAITSNSTAISGGANGEWSLTYTPPLYTFGNPLTSIRYYVKDGELESAEQTLSIIVNHVNHAPVASAQTLVVLVEDSFTDMTLIGNDVDSSDELVIHFVSIPYSIASLGSNFTFTSTGEAITTNKTYNLPRDGIKVRFSPPMYQFFNDSYVFEVSDGELSSRLSVFLTTLDSNHIPVGYSQTIDMDEDSETLITFTGSDVDIPADTLTFTISTVPSRGNLYDGDVLVKDGHLLSGNTVTFKPLLTTYGAPYTSFTYTVFDGKISSTRESIIINVHHINHAPTISTTPSSITIDRYGQGSFVVGGKDVDLIDTISLRTVIPQSLNGKVLYNGTQVSDGQVFVYDTTSFTEAFTYVGPLATEGVTPDYGDSYGTITFVVFDNANSSNSQSSTEVGINIRFISRTPTASSDVSLIVVNERESGSVTLSGSDRDNQNVTLVLKIAPSIGSLYLSNSDKALSVGDTIGAGVSPNISVRYASPQPSSEYASTGAQSGSFSFEVNNGDKSVESKIDISIRDVNFAPFVFATEANITILDSQSDRHVTFVVSAIDPDEDITDAYVLSHKNTEIKLQQDGNDVDMTKPLKKVSDGLWKLDVVVPALFVGEVDRIKVYTQDPLGLKSSELELVVRTAYVNFAPVTTTTSIPAFNEDQSVTFTIGGKDDNKEALSAFISDLPHIGTLKDSNGNAITSNSTAISGGANGEWTLTYTPPLYTFGDPLTSIQYYVSDGELESAEQTLSIIVNHVNHAPVLVSNSDIYVFEIPHTSDDISSYPTLNSVITLNALDVDRADILKVNITSLPNSSFGYLAIDGEAISKVGTIVPAGANATFIPINYVSGEAGSFSYYVTDGIEETETLTVPVHVIDINHIPEVILTSESVNVNENSTVTVTLAQTGRFVDPDGDDLTLSLKTSPTRGVMSSISKTGTKTQSVWTFTYTPNFSVDSVSYGQLYDKVEFIVGDGKKSSSNSLTVNFNVLKVNFPPIARDFKVSGNLVELVAIDFSSRISDIHGESLSVIIKSLPATGSLTSNSQTIQPSQLPFTIANSGITSLEYHSPEPSQVDTSFKYAAFNGYAESGDYSVNVVITGFFNNPPIAFASPDTYTTPENQNVAITLGGLDEDGDFLTAYITKLPTTGVLRQTTNGISVGRLINAGDKVDLTDAWRLIYIPDSLKGEGTFSFSYHLNDSKTISNEQKVNLVVTNVIYPPTGVSIPPIVSTNEGTNVLITLQGTDPDGLSMTAQLTADTSNSFLFLGDSKGAIIDDKPIRLPSEFEPYVFPSSADGKWYVVYQPPAYKSGNGFDNFFFQVVNSANLKSVESIVLINVVAVNDPPIIDVPANITTPAGIAVPVKGIVVRELDFNVNNAQKPYVATVKADIGKVSIPNTVGVEVTPEDFATGAPSITITGRFSDVNAALSGLVFSPPPNVNGTTHVSVTVNDGGNTGIGGAKETTVQIKVSLSANVDDSTAGANVTPAVAGGAVGAVAAIAGAFWAFKRVSAKENYSFQLPEKDGDIFSSNPIYEADNEQGKAMKSNPLYQPAAASQ